MRTRAGQIPQRSTRVVFSPIYPRTRIDLLHSAVGGRESSAFGAFGACSVRRELIVSLE